MDVTVDEFKDAAWNGDIDVVKEYVESGGDIHASASNGVGALVSKHVSILEYLYAHGADVNHIWSDGNPAICFHAWEVHLDCLEWFLSNGANPNLCHRQTGENSLHALSVKPQDLEKRFQGIQMLIKHGIDINKTTASGVLTGQFMRDVRVVGESSLHRAAAYQPQKTIELLIQSGADVSQKDAREESPLSWASRHWRDRAILKILCYDHFRV